MARAGVPAPCEVQCSATPRRSANPFSRSSVTSTARVRGGRWTHPSYIHGRSPVHAGLVLLPAFAMLAALAPLLATALGGRTATARA